MSMPATFPDALTELADWLDLTDQVAVQWAADRGHAWVPGNEMQADLRAVAVWAEAHPSATVAELNAEFCAIRERAIANPPEATHAR